MVFDIVVPKENSWYAHCIKKGSGIIMYREAHGNLLVDFEGNLYGADELKTFHGRIRHAAYRAIEQYPTVARMLVMNPNELVKVGEYDSDANQMRVDTTNPFYRYWVDDV